MALATRCPACHTAFRVVSDQLKLHQGLVRCGHCDHVFNGLRHLLGADAAGTPAPAKSTPPAPVTHVPSSTLPSTEVGTFDTVSLGNHRRVQIPSLLQELEEEDAPYFLVPPQTPIQHSPPDTAPQTASPATEENASVFNANHDVAPTTVAGTAAEIDEQLLSPPEHLTLTPSTYTSEIAASATQDSAFVAPTLAKNIADNAEAEHSEVVLEVTAHEAPEQIFRNEVPNTELDSVSAKPAESSEFSDTGVGTQLEELTDVTFLKAAAARQKARRSPWRWWWRGLAVLLTLLATVQGAWLLRSQISVQFPTLEPLFKEACAALDCTWTPPQQIDALLIEQSSLQKSDGGPNSYALNVTLRNKADISIAMPAIELSLTDLQGQLLTRKVFLPQEYLGKATGNLLQQGMSPQTEVPLRLQLELNQAALNYRVLIFYP